MVHVWGGTNIGGINTEEQADMKARRTVSRAVESSDSYVKGRDKMKNWLLTISSVVVIVTMAGSWTLAQRGQPTVNPQLSSAGALAFGPDDTLFIADNKAATIFALQLGGEEPGDTPGTAAVEQLDRKIAALLGTGADEILINDIAVSPNSRNTFLSVSRGRAESAPVLLRVDGAGAIDVIELDQIAYTQVEFPNPAEDFMPPNPSGRARPVYFPAANPRMDTVTDMEYVDGQVILSGLSNEEFASKLRAVNYPFSGAGRGISIEIWHASHGAWETRAPVYTFVPYEIDGEPNLIAGYFCTPLVRFPLDALAAGNAFTGKVRGTTIAELGAFNRPLDMVVYERGGEEFLLMTTVSKGVMKMSMEDVARQEPLTRQVPEMEDIAGVPFERIDRMEGTSQLAMLDDTRAVIVIRDGAGMTNLDTIALP